MSVSVRCESGLIPPVLGGFGSRCMKSFNFEMSYNGPVSALDQPDDPNVDHRLTVCTKRKE